MTPVQVRHDALVPVMAYPDCPAVRCDKDVTSRSVIGPAGRPLLLWKHELPEGTGFTFAGSRVDHGFYVAAGTVEGGSERVGPGGFLTVEHGAHGTVRAVSGPAILLHYQPPEDIARAPSRAGGRIHAVGADGILQTDQPEYGHRGTLLADSDCPTCAVWLHKSEFLVPAQNASRLHYHTADEIIYILEGEMIIGNRKLQPGTAIAIDEGTKYQFGVGEKTLVYLNFRPADSLIVQAGHEDHPIHEVDYWRESAVQRPMPAS